MSDDDPRWVRPPRGAFWWGALVGLGAALPLTIVAAFALSRAGIGNGEASLARIAAFACVFAGLPALLSAAGVGRVAGRAARLATEARVQAAVRAGAIGFAPAGVGVLLLAMLPLGGLPEERWRWLWLVATGGVAGAAAGAAIGWVVAWRDSGTVTTTETETDDAQAR